ncbi:hypothetical protein AN5110.2 [Aspergillus nidulans FGSC A4]|nr:hypothetical protein AN5110.2 [Aspergillus nidulans FGSC A4]|eukprot:XP_662714.1 hypothetical protein AN5110.2 [Aspergillus nidulans FGSC A4]
MASQFSKADMGAGLSLAELPKSNVFTSKLPPDPAFDTPEASHKAQRERLYPRTVKGAAFTFVRPETTEDPELLGVSPRAMKDLGLKPGEENTAQFKAVVAGNEFYWDEENGGVYPWAQCYGVVLAFRHEGTEAEHQQRAISLFESTNPSTNVRYEVQLKGAGRTPYSRFADGKAVLRSSIHVVAISNTCIFGTFDLPHSRGDRNMVRKLATYVAEDVFNGWESLPGAVSVGKDQQADSVEDPPRGLLGDKIQDHHGVEENRFARLYREIARRNAKTVAAWQAYGFMNGVLNTDNTSVYGLSLDYGPFAFMDNFDPQYTPNHDDHMLRYSYKNQPSVIWWNLVRLGECLGELIGAGPQVDDENFVKQGVTEDAAPALIKRAETIIERTGDEYRTVFLNQYKCLMSKRLGLRTQKESDFQELYSELLDTLEALELDFNHFFRRLSSVPIVDLETEAGRKDIAHIFFHIEGHGGIGYTEDSARERIAKWLDRWRQRVLEDWGTEADADIKRQEAMKKVNPKFVPRGWILEEVIERVERRGDRDILGRVMNMALNPFNEEWGLNREEEERFCGDVPRFQRAMMCSCSS